MRVADRYELLGSLSHNRHGAVCLARSPDGLVCVKLLSPTAAEDVQIKSLFRDEGHLGSLVKHESCVRVLDQGNDRDLEYIVFEHILGHPFSVVIATAAAEGGRIDPAVVAHIVASVCDALHHAHEVASPTGRAYQVVHRDICPHNIMLSFDGEAKLMDFGVARAETGREKTATGVVRGRYAYMSPEHITGEKLDRRSDVFAMGVVLFEALAGRRLHQNRSPDEIALHTVSGRLPSLREAAPEIDPRLCEIFSTATSRVAAHRFQTAHSMAEALRNYRGQIGAAPGRPALQAEMTKWVGMDLSDRRSAQAEIADGHASIDTLLPLLLAKPLPKNVTAIFRPAAEVTDVFENPMETNAGDSALTAVTPHDLPFIDREITEIPSEPNNVGAAPVSYSNLTADLIPDVESASFTPQIAEPSPDLERSPDLEVAAISGEVPLESPVRGTEVDDTHSPHSTVRMHSTQTVVLSFIVGAIAGIAIALVAL